MFFSQHIFVGFYPRGIVVVWLRSLLYNLLYKYTIYWLIVYGHLSCFLLEVINNIAVMNVLEHLSCKHGTYFTGVYPRSGIAGQ